MGISIRDRLHIASIAVDCAGLARRFGLGLEIDEFCTAANLDAPASWVEKTEAGMRGVGRFVLHAPFNELVPVSIDPKIRAVTELRYCQAHDMASRLGIRRMVYHTGFLPNTTHSGWYTEQCAAFWREFAADRPDTQFLLENVFEDSPERMLRLHDGICQENVKLCLDAGHANCSSEAPPEDWLRTLGDRIAHVHLHNNFGKRDEHLPLGDGGIDMKRLLERIDLYAPDATITIECEQAASSLNWLQKMRLL